MEINLYRDSVYTVYYGAGMINKFELKTLKGCLRKIEKLGIKKYKIIKYSIHRYDPTDNIRELIQEQS